MKAYFLWLAKLITILVLLSFFFVVILGAGAKLAVDVASVTSPSKGTKVGVVELVGMITDVSKVVKQLEEYSEDSSIHGIVLRIDSPGGAVGPSQEMNQAVARVRAEHPEKPVVVSMGSVAASGGLYSALSAQKIFAQPGTLTGSIGVIMQIPNFAGIADKIGFTMMTVKSGSMKDAGNSFRPMTDEEKGYLEETAHRVHEQFIRDVAKGRNLPIEKVRSFADGRALTGEDAKAVGLIDDFGDVTTAAKAALTLAGKENDKPLLVYPDKRFAELKDLLQNATNLFQSYAPLTSSRLLFLYQ